MSFSKSEELNIDFVKRFPGNYDATPKEGITIQPSSAAEFEKAVGGARQIPNPKPRVASEP